MLNRSDCVVERLSGSFIVSCQALEGEPLHGSIFMRQMAVAAIEGGAQALRMNSGEDIKAAKGITDVPIIGLVKRDYPSTSVFITPTKLEILEVAESGAEVVAIDMTARVRPTSDTLEDLVDYAHSMGLLVMADLGSMNDAPRAFDAGADFLGTTLSGYTEETHGQVRLPDFGFMEALVRTYSHQVPIIAEGGINTPEEAVHALRIGCHAVVVGSAITRPHLIASRFGSAIASWQQGAGGLRI